MSNVNDIKVKEEEVGSEPSGADEELKDSGPPGADVDLKDKEESLIDPELFEDIEDIMDEAEETVVDAMTLEAMANPGSINRSDSIDTIDSSIETIQESISNMNSVGIFVEQIREVDVFQKQHIKELNNICAKQLVDVHNMRMEIELLRRSKEELKRSKEELENKLASIKIVLGA